MERRHECRDPGPRETRWPDRAVGRRQFIPVWPRKENLSFAEEKPRNYTVMDKN
jgi:hypothetical protein